MLIRVPGLLQLVLTFAYSRVMDKTSYMPMSMSVPTHKAVDFFLRRRQCECQCHNVKCSMSNVTAMPMSVSVTFSFSCVCVRLTRRLLVRFHELPVDPEQLRAVQLEHSAVGSVD